MTGVGATYSPTGVGSSRYMPTVQDLAASQKSEFERRGALQQLQTGGIQQESMRFDLAQKRKQDEIERILANPYTPFQGQTMSYNEAANSLYGQGILRKQEMENLELNRMRMMYGGGSGSGGWSANFSAPSFPSR